MREKSEGSTRGRFKSGVVSSNLTGVSIKKARYKDMAISDFTNKQIVEISKRCKTKNELAKALGYANGGGTTNEIINRKLQELGINFVSVSNSNRRYTDK